MKPALSKRIKGLAGSTKPSNQQVLMIRAIRGETLITYVSQAIILLTMQMYIDIPVLFNGPYEDFTSMWYIRTGSNLILTMGVSIIAQYEDTVENIGELMLKRFWDRGCTFKESRTKKRL